MSTHLAYLAGFFDGEGTLGHYSSGGYTYFRMFLTNTNRAILDTFAETFGGSICKKHLGPLSRKPAWTWTIHNDKAWDAYYAMEPYLREKRWKQEPR